MIAVGAGVMAASSSVAQIWNMSRWSVEDLHPDGYNQSFATSVGASGIGGYGVHPSSAGPKAMTWSLGGAFTALDRSGHVNHVNGGFFGSSESGGSYRPGYWNEQGVFTDLLPSRASGGDVYAGIGQYQYGFVDGHAARWQGSASSYSNFRPSGSLSSHIWAGAGTEGLGIQVGDVKFSGQAVHGAFWRGTSWSFQDLTPAGATTSLAISAGTDRDGDYLIGGHTNLSTYNGVALWRAQMDSGAAVYDSELSGWLAGTGAASVRGIDHGFAVGGGSGLAAHIWDLESRSHFDLSEVGFLAGLNTVWVNGIHVRRDEAGEVTGITAVGAYDSNGFRAVAWHYSPSPVPEPATIAALGLGIAGLMRRRSMGSRKGKGAGNSQS